MPWLKNTKIRGGSAYFSGTATLAGGGTLPQNAALGLRGNVDFRGGTIRVPGGVGTAGLGTADLQALVLSFGGGSARLTGVVGGTVYTWLGIAQP